MKICFMLALACAAATVSLADDVYLVRDGKPAATIVVGEKASAQAKEAAAELQAYLKRMSGGELPVVEKAATGGTTVLVGQAAGREAAAAMGLSLPTGLSDDFNDEGYVVAAAGKTLLLAGNETEPYQGTYYAVADFLESLGCRWYFPGAFGEVVPRMASVKAAAVRKVVRPQLRVRDTWYSGHLTATAEQQSQFALWKRHNRMSRPDLWQFGARFLQNPVDDSTYRLLPKEKYWAAHPEYYALNPDGTRNDRFLCMSSPAALGAATDTVVEYFREHPDFHDFAFSPPDAPVLCNCPDCTRAMHGQFNGEGNGQVSDAYFGFVFKLADAVAKGAPGHYITTMAYYNRCRPPEGVDGRRSNMLIQLASIQQCSLHSYADDRCWSRQEYGAMLRRWAALTAGQVFYEYDPHDWTHSQRPGWRSQGIAQDLRLLKRLGGWGYSNEGQMAWMATGLNYYVRARLAWDVGQDPAAMVRDFCDRFFGPAGEPMRRYCSAIEDAIRNCPSDVFAVWDGAAARDAIPVIFSAARLDQCANMLAEAARKASDEPYKARVRAFRLHFDRLNGFAKAHDAMVRGQYREAAAFADDMVKAVKDLNDTALLQDAGPWGGACSGATIAAYARRIQPWTDGTKGRLVAALPAAALFRADPAPQGLVHRWFAGDDPKAWRPIRMTSAWEHQGIVTPQGRPYRGIGWYRVALQLDRKPDGPVNLYLPDLRGSGLWAWCNGAFAGYVAAGDEPIIDMAGRLKAGANDLEFRVDGAGLGLPPFLFKPAGALASEVSVFPAQWLFRLDPEDRGQKEGWQRADVDEAGWRTIPVPAWWEKTPVGQYDGVAWYRVRFRLPDNVAGKKLVLAFGAVDEEAWVYLNGELIGEHTAASTSRTVDQIWDEPFEIPVRNVRPGENVLVVRVHDSTLMGGIFKPVKLGVSGDGH
jgi:hypothetical protein